MLRHILSAMALASALACAGNATGPAPPDEGDLRVLFVGNSLTYAWELPEMVAELSAASGAEHPVWVRSVVAPNFSLEDHWYVGEVQRLLREQAWDVVVLQQGPSSLPQNGVHLAEWAGRFAPLIREAGAVPALYMVWPSADRSFAFDAVRDHYAAAARAVDGHFFPVGEAWRAAWRMDPELALYDMDAFHPSRTAVFLAALVITAQLHDVSPVELPGSLAGTRGPAVQLDGAVADVLRAAAAEAIAAHGF